MATALIAFVAHLGGVAPTTDVDAFVRREQARQRIPGVAVAVVRGGRPIILRGFGRANLEQGTSVTPDTVFRIGSVSKQFLAAAVVKLAEEGKLHLDDEASKFLPGAPPEWHGVTLRRLLSHTAGLPRELPGWRPDVRYTEDDWLRLAVATKPTTSPGTSWTYSNAGYFVAALVISRAAGIPWTDYVDRSLFRPLGMTRTRVDSSKDLISGRASGYELVGESFRNDDPMVSVRPSGAFVSTARDLARWEAALASGVVLPRNRIAEMTMPSRLLTGDRWPYGLGWYLDLFGADPVVHHGGTIQGFRAEFARYVGKDLTVIVLANAAHAQCKPIAQGLARRVEPSLTRTTVRLPRDPSPVMTSDVAAFLKSVSQGSTYDGDLATDSLKSAIRGYPAPMRRELATALSSVKYLAAEEVARHQLRQQNQEISRVRFYQVGPAFLTAYFTAEDKLAFFELSPDRP